MGGVILCGTVVPLILALVGIGVESAREAIAVIDTVLLVVFGFFLRLATLRVGIFPPLRLGFPERS